MYTLTLACCLFSLIIDITLSLGFTGTKLRHKKYINIQNIAQSITEFALGRLTMHYCETNDLNNLKSTEKTQSRKKVRSTSIPVEPCMLLDGD